MKKGVVFVVGLLGLTVVIVAQYATGSNAIVDMFGNLMGFFRRAYFTAKTTTEDTLNTVTGGNTGSPDPMEMALPIIAGFEGFVGHAYQDIAGIWTIGYGHKIVDGDGFRKASDQLISESGAWDLLRNDAQSAYDCVLNGVQVELAPEQIAALISFCFNVGCGAFTQSTMLKDINAGDLASAVDQFSRWKYAGGKVVKDLETRRQQESDLFASVLNLGGGNA